MKNIFKNWDEFWNTDFHKLKVTDKAIRTMSKEDQDYIDQNHPNRRQDIGEIDNLLDTYNRVYGTKAKLALDFEHFELIIDNVWINSVNGISRKVLKPLKLHFFNYDPGDEYMRFDFDLII